jgi:hypothetical protein
VIVLDSINPHFMASYLFGDEAYRTESVSYDYHTLYTYNEHPSVSTTRTTQGEYDSVSLNLNRLDGYYTDVSAKFWAHKNKDTS